LKTEKIGRREKERRKETKEAEPTRATPRVSRWRSQSTREEVGRGGRESDNG
jgi:hypothetical protein